MKLSFVLPAIRVDRWDALYRSIKLDFDWELIICSPYSLPASMNHKNVKLIKDFGSPMRASCIAANQAVGKYITWVADDATVFSNTVNKAINLLDSEDNEKLVIVTKYLEACTEVHPDSYYKLTNAYPKSPYLSNDWWIFNTAFMHNSYYKYLGGWDTVFEACPLGHADLAARAQLDGCKTILIQDAFLDCDHMPGVTGDHGPVCHAHQQHDDPHYAKIYNSPDYMNRIRIDINNWKNSPAIWKRRF